MSLIFLAPLFLLGLVALVVPLLVHLTNRPRDRAVPFPSLMLLRRLPYRSVRRQQIEHWLLLLLRVGAVSLPVIAFARPLLEGSGPPPFSQDDRQEVVILLDGSFSMGYGDRWERALAEAHSRISRLKEGDRASLILFSDRPKVLPASAGDQAALVAALKGATVSAQGTRFGPALETAAEILTGSDLKRGEVILISDFQKTGWIEHSEVSLPPAAVLTVVDVSGETSPRNLAITGAGFERVRRGQREWVAVTARLVNFGREPAKGVAVRLKVEDKEMGVSQVDLEGLQAASVQFDEVPASDRPLKIEVSLEGDPLAIDNRYYAVVGPAEVIPVLMVVHPLGPPRNRLFIERALALGNDPRFELVVRTADRVTARDLAGARAVIVDDSPYPAGAAGRALGEFVTRGGGVLVILGRRSDPDSWLEAASLLPGKVGSVVDRTADQGARLGFLDYTHPVLEIFREPHSGDFSAVRTFRYRHFELYPGGKLLASYDDGSVALAEQDAAGGPVVVWSSAMDNLWSDFPVQPVFLPFLHQLVAYLAGYAPPRVSYMVGDVVDLGALAGGAVAQPEVVVDLPSGGRKVRRLRPGASSLVLEEAGFYRVRHAGSQTSAGFLLAANVDPAESDLTPIDPEEIARAVTASGARARVGAGDPVLAPEARERRQQLWWYLLLGAVALLAIESVVARRHGPRKGAA